MFGVTYLLRNLYKMDFWSHMLVFDNMYYVIALNIEILTNDSFKIVINQQLE